MISSLAIALLLPLSLPAQQFGQEHVQSTAYSPIAAATTDIISLREDPQGHTPAGFATLSAIFVGPPVGYYAVITRTDKDRNVLWMRGLPGLLTFNQIIQTQDGGILAIGLSYLVKLDALGNVLWSRLYWSGSASAITELDDGSVLMVTDRTVGPTAPSSLGVIRVDANGVVISMWSMDDLPGGEVYSFYPTAITSKGQEAVFCGSVRPSIEGPPPHPDPRSTFVCKISTACDCPLWAFTYPISPAEDLGTGIQWRESGDVVVTGVTSADAYFLKIDSNDGAALEARVYEDLQLSDVVEFLEPNNPDGGSTLCFSGRRLTGGMDSPTLMLTDSHGVPSINMLYNVDNDMTVSSVTPCYEAHGQSGDGFFAVGSKSQGGFSPPYFQHWIRTDTDLSTGCLEESYSQAHTPLTIDPQVFPLELAAIDGVSDLDYAFTDSTFTQEPLCPADDFTALCFGDSSGTPCPCGNTAAPGAGCANSTGLGAVLSGSGTPSISADSVSLSVDQGKPNQPVLFFQGLNFINSGNGNHFGDGLRCCGGSVKRLQVRFMNASGQASTTAPLSIQGSTAAGSTYCNQAWYRDPLAAGGSPCLNYFNTSNALSITWAP